MLGGAPWWSVFEGVLPGGQCWEVSPGGQCWKVSSLLVIVGRYPWWLILGNVSPHGQCWKVLQFSIVDPRQSVLGGTPWWPILGSVSPSWSAVIECFKVFHGGPPDGQYWFFPHIINAGRNNVGFQVNLKLCDATLRFGLIWVPPIIVIYMASCATPVIHVS